MGRSITHKTFYPKQNKNLTVERKHEENDTEEKIAIIGGGIAGLTFAHSLKSKNFEIHIFEKKEQFGEIGAAISVFPNALSVMDELGLLNTILKSSGQFKTIYLKTNKWVFWSGRKKLKHAKSII